MLKSAAFWSSMAPVMAGLAVLLPASEAFAGPTFGPTDIRTLFVISDNTDRNEVQYGIHLDKDCSPVGDAPLYVYWRRLEKGPDVVEDLGMLDRTVYGIKGQWVTKRTPEESKVIMTLKATSERGIAVVVHKRDGKCTADPITNINGNPSLLSRVFVHVAGFLKVDWIEIRGIFSGAPIVERVMR